MNLKNKIRRTIMCGTLALINAPAIFAQQNYKEFSSLLDGITQEAGKWTNSLLNLISVIVGLIGIVMLVWNYIKANKSDGQSNDAMISWGWRLIFVFAAIQLIKVVLL